MIPRFLEEANARASTTVVYLLLWQPCIYRVRRGGAATAVDFGEGKKQQQTEHVARLIIRSNAPATIKEEECFLPSYVLPAVPLALLHRHRLLHVRTAPVTEL
jgi:hypothetical protein